MTGMRNFIDIIVNESSSLDWFITEDILNEFFYADIPKKEINLGAHDTAAQPKIDLVSHDEARGRIDFNIDIPAFGHTFSFRAVGLRKDRSRVEFHWSLEGDDMTHITPDKNVAILRRLGPCLKTVLGKVIETFPDATEYVGCGPGRARERLYRYTADIAAKYGLQKQEVPGGVQLVRPEATA